LYNDVDRRLLFNRWSWQQSGDSNFLITLIRRDCTEMPWNARRESNSRSQLGKLKNECRESNTPLTNSRQLVDPSLNQSVLAGTVIKQLAIVLRKRNWRRKANQGRRFLEYLRPV
jgi:hypothetical protein